MIEYKGKGYFSGKSHSFKATLTPQPGRGGSATKEIVVEGTWHQNSKFTTGGHGSFHDVSGPKEVVTAVGAEASGEMGPMETRKLWELVAKGIREGDFELASREKTRIEVRFSCFRDRLGILISGSRTKCGSGERTRQPAGCRGR